MKRALLFLLLGAVLCVALLCAPPALHSPKAFWPIFLGLAPIMFPLAVGLMAIAGVVDWLLADKGWIRIIASSLVAFAVVIVFQYATGSVSPLVGFAGAVPAAICSWLSAGKGNVQVRKEWV
ncbi:hypothetical protein JQ580_25250 [Bradyrhizobium japonicum]|uniref:hypothetical protein n=1 Tax=Bradyrhizobium japonicum TaxID=375 RepID=UPI001BA47BB4|nr:hypothetical protein [Bradyrhizobium japonicum]MBR0994032.1 hypothetical protein [Bradyrhizobium japonicum]